MNPALSCRDRAWPAPGVLLGEMPLWVALLAAAFVPGRWAPQWELAGAPWRAVEVLIVFAGLLSLAALVLCPVRPAGSGRRFRAWWLLVAWAAATLAWSPREGPEAAGMVAAVVTSVGASVAAWAVWRGPGAHAPAELLTRLTVFVGLVGAIYGAESLWALGLREAAHRIAETAFPIERVRGPLFSASTGYLALLPALGWSLDWALGHRAAAPESLSEMPGNGRGRRSVAVALAALLVATLAGLGSRAALAVLLGFLGLLIWWMPGPRRLCMLAVAALAGVLAVAAAVSRISPERFQVWTDPGRLETHQAAWRILEAASPGEALRGAGLGAVWCWYLADAVSGEQIAAGNNRILTAGGESLYHPHSLLLLAAVELGLPGLLLLAWLLGELLMAAWALRQAGAPALGAALAASTGSFFFDLFLFKNIPVSLVWWCYAFGALYLGRAGRRAWSC